VSRSHHDRCYDADPTAEGDIFSAVTVATPFSSSFADAVDAFCARPELAELTARTYRRALGRLVDELGAMEPTAAELERAVCALWGDLAPASWNRNVATVRSLLRWAARRDYLEPEVMLRLDRRREPTDRTRSIPYPALERLWLRDDVALREKTLWRLLYETAARAGEILALDIDDLDLPNHRARIRSKGGDLELVHFQSGAARVLPRLLAGRRVGPAFVTDRVAPAGTPSLDVCPVTGHARLSYRRAAAIFADQTGGWTLHQLRHSAITHLAESGESTVLLMAKSRHRSLRTLQRYARPGAEAVAALTARHDPGRRRP
jgi:integrase